METKIGKLYFNLNILKEMFDIPQDIFLRSINVNNEQEEIEIIYYTNTNWDKTIPINKLNSLSYLRRITPKLKEEYIISCYKALNSVDK